MDLTNKDFEKLRDFFASREDELVSVLERLCRHPSVRGPEEEGAPFGRECLKCLKDAAAIFEERGFTARLSPENKYAIVSYGSGDKTIGIFAHTDVVPAGSGWIYGEPFSPTVKDGMFIARGSEDNKSGVAAALLTLEAVRELYPELGARLVVFLGSDEESGMGDIMEFRRRERMPDISFIPDNGFPLSVGEKGILRLWARSDFDFPSVSAFCAGEAFNVIPGEATATLRPDIHVEKAILEKYGVTADKGPDGSTSLSARGLSAHAGTPAGAVNAASLICRVISECGGIGESEKRAARMMGDALSSTDGSVMGIAAEDPDFSPLTAANGMVRRGDDGTLAFSFDIRYGASVNGDEVIKKLRDYFASMRFSVDVEENKPGFIIKDNKLTSALLKVYREYTGDNDAKAYLSNGGTYARYLINAFSHGTVISSGEPRIRFPEGHGTCHQPDEAVDIKGLAEGSALMCAMILGAV